MFIPSKKLGQNFLTDDTIAKQIINKIVGAPQTIIEVGPGKGALTKHIINKAPNIVLIELDKRLASDLSSLYKNKENIKIINNDVLEVDFAPIKSGETVLVSNLPYSISTPMMLHFLKQQTIEVFYCVLQKELADRLVSQPQRKEYGSISVLVQYYCDIEFLMAIDKKSFSPQPKVQSSFIKIIKKNIPYNQEFNNFIRNCFRFKRKTLVNNLKALYPQEKILCVLKQLKIDNNIRAEAISVDTIYQIYQLIIK